MKIIWNNWYWINPTLCIFLSPVIAYQNQENAYILFYAGALFAVNIIRLTNQIK